MNTQWSDRDIESLLVGHPTASGLAHLAPFVEAVRRGAMTPPTVERTTVVARTLAVAAREGIGQAPVRQPKAPVTWKRRFAMVGGIAALATVGVGGAAAAADGAAPGDFLYSVDRAFEVIGIGNGGTGERLHEAVRLADKGDLDQALHHAAKAIEAEGDEESAGALVQAAAEVQNQGAEQSLEVRNEVSEMLMWMESTDAKGKGFGQGVSERAKSIKDTASHGKSDDAPGQNKDNGEEADNPSPDTSSNDLDKDPGKGSGKGSKA